MLEVWSFDLFVISVNKTVQAYKIAYNQETPSTPIIHVSILPKSKIA